MDLNRRIDLLCSLGEWMKLDDPVWLDVQERANHANPWFTQQQVTMAIENIVTQFLQEDKLRTWVQHYHLPVQPKLVGIVMAGNIPLVGFHDFLCGFISGHRLKLKLSSRDEILLTYIIGKLGEWEPEVLEQVTIADNLKACDAYIATGSNNTARYFEQYFNKYPNIIRKNRTSVAILDGTETADELRSLADDVFSFYGLGCRNVTQICVPKGYDFQRLLDSFRSYDDIINQHKYKNNYDYHLAIYLLNLVPYMTNDMVLLVENDLPFSAVSVLHYRYYDDKEKITTELQARNDIQAMIGHGSLPFGSSQRPTLSDHADGVDTMAFLCTLN